jgi:tetratricopeptide (TPR) repeat protein
MRIQHLLCVCALAWFAAAGAAAQGAAVQGAGAQVSPTPAQGPEADHDSVARGHFESGNTAFAAADYGTALREFEQAYALSKRPALLYNISLCHQFLGQLDEAIASLARYLAETPDITNRAQLEERLRNLRVQRDDAKAASAKAAGPAPAKEVSSEASSGLSTPVLVSFIVGGVGVVAFAAFGILAVSEDASLAGSACGKAGTCTDDDVSSLETYTLLADVGLAVGVIGAGLGVMFLLLEGDEKNAEPVSAASLGIRSLGVEPFLTGTSAGALVTGRF